MLICNLNETVAKVGLFLRISYVINDCNNGWISLDDKISWLVRYSLQDPCRHLSTDRIDVPSWRVRHRL